MLRQENKKDIVLLRNKQMRYHQSKHRIHGEIGNRREVEQQNDCGIIKKDIDRLGVCVRIKMGGWEGARLKEAYM